MIQEEDEKERERRIGVALLLQKPETMHGFDSFRWEGTIAVPRLSHCRCHTHSTTQVFRDVTLTFMVLSQHTVCVTNTYLVTEA